MGVRCKYDVFRDDKIILLDGKSNEVAEAIGCSLSKLYDMVNIDNPIGFHKGYRIVWHSVDTSVKKIEGDSDFIKMFKEEWDAVCNKLRGISR